MSKNQNSGHGPNPYAGRIGNTGLNHVKAPFPAGKGGGKTVTVTGGDLRSNTGGMDKK